MPPIRFAAAALALVLLAGEGAATAQAVAQSPPEPPARRLDRLDRAVRDLNAIVRQGAATGRPVIVAPETLPGELDGLRTRLDDLEAARRDQTSTIEALTADLAAARRTVGEAQAQVRDLQARVTALEAAAKAAAAAVPPPPEPAGEETPAPATGGEAARPEAVFQRARQRLLEGDYAGAGAGFQDYVTRFPDGAQTAEARYWLAETQFIREQHAAAAQNYALALQGWPKGGWAPDAVVKLSGALTAIDRAPAACQALAELDRRYPQASAAVTARAKTARTRTRCSSPPAGA